MNRIKVISLLGVIFTFFLITGSTQVNDIQLPEEQNAVTDREAQEEEFHRYLGYESTFLKYITLPYDLVMNLNLKGQFTDIWVLLFLILPILVLYNLKNKPRLLSVVGIGLLAYLIFCVLATGSFENSLLQSLSKKIKSLDFAIDEKGDPVTYPLLVVVYLIINIIAVRLDVNRILKILIITTVSYFSLWHLFSSGVPWYGFLVLPIGLVLSVALYSQATDSKVIKTLASSAFILSVMVLFVNKISNIEMSMTDENTDHHGKSIIHASIFPYTMGVMNNKELLNYVTSNLGNALTEINTNKDKIYMIGTSFKFNIDHADERIVNDNTLTMFWHISVKLKEKTEVIKALKAYGFRYIVIDLHTPTLDRTPEKSIIEKFNILLQTVWDNSHLKLVATDRIVEVKLATGETRQIFHIYGDKLIHFGNYAIYEIL